MSDLATASLAGTILLAAMGAAALSLLVARHGICPSDVAVDWTARRRFVARCTYFAVGAALALSGVLAAVALSVELDTRRRADDRPAAEVRALEARIQTLETMLRELDLRTARSTPSADVVME